MKLRIALIVLMLLSLLPLWAQAQQRISGFVKDANTGERLIGATVSVSSRGTTTDNNGYFSLPITRADSVSFSFIGYSPVKILISPHRDTILEVLLHAGHDLSEVVVRAERLSGGNIVRLSGMELQAFPSLSGKPDVMRAMQLLPGVMSQSEGSSLLLVRGGNPGENIYLFDNVPIIYVNHLGGFMSVFNPDIINSMDLYKGNFPARYGGKLSSIVDITQREGNQSGFKGSYHIGLTDVSLSLEGPIHDDVSLIFTGRKTLFDLLFLGASTFLGGNDASVFYGFHDVNTKLSWKPNTRNSFHFNIFQGDDYWNFRTKASKENPNRKNVMTYIWGNWMISGGWKHVASSRLFVENNIAYTRYRTREQQKMAYKENDVTQNQSFKSLSSVDMLSFISSWKYTAHQKWKIDFGFNSFLASLLPVYSQYSNQPTTAAFERIPTFENAVYMDNFIELPVGFRLQAGMRAVHFNNANFNSVKAEPRVSLHKHFASDHQVSAGFSRVNQFSHLLFTPGSIFSNEVWIPADGRIKPSRSDQFTLGWIGSFADGGYQSEVNVYYKTLSDLSTYREGYSNLRGDGYWQSKIENEGTGEAYGLELLIRKNRGEWTGFVSYAWSKATRTFPNINRGNTFVFDYDRPHSASVSVSHHFNRRFSLNAVWVFQSGIPYTPVIGRQLSPSLWSMDDELPNPYEAFIYGERNSSRMKDYHRLDLSLTINRYTFENKLKSSWTLGLYNAYNRKNPVYYYYNNNPSSDILNPEYNPGMEYKPFELYQFALFPIIPNFSYRYYFGQGPVKPRVEAPKRIAYSDSYIKGRWNIKLTGAYGSRDRSYGRSYESYMNSELNYGFFKYLEAGLSLGAREISVLIPDGVSNFGYFVETVISPTYGLNSNFHLLPFIVKREKFWLDLYLAGKFGGMYVPHDFAFKKLSWNYYRGMGLAVYPLKRLGLYTEVGLAKPVNPKFESPNVYNVKIGVAVRF